MKVTKAVRLKPRRVWTSNGKNEFGLPLDLKVETQLLKDVILDIQRESNRILTKQGPVLEKRIRNGYKGITPREISSYPSKAHSKIGMRINKLSHLKSRAMVEYLISSKVVNAIKSKIALEDSGQDFVALATGRSVDLSPTNNNYYTHWLSSDLSVLYANIYTKDHRAIYSLNLPGHIGHNPKLVKICRPTILIDKKGELTFSYPYEIEVTPKPITPKYVIGVDMGNVEPISWVVMDIEKDKLIEKGTLPVPLRKLQTKKKRLQKEIVELIAKNKDNPEIPKKRTALSHKKQELSKGIGQFLSELSKDYGSAVIILEDLKNMNGPSYALNQWERGAIAHWIKSSAKDNGLIPVYLVNRAYTSQNCSDCGYRANNFEGRLFVCTDCGYRENRDINAAINIARRGYSRALKTSNTRKTKLGLIK